MTITLEQVSQRLREKSERRRQQRETELRDAGVTVMPLTDEQEFMRQDKEDTEEFFNLTPAKRQALADRALRMARELHPDNEAKVREFYESYLLASATACEEEGRIELAQAWLDLAAAGVGH